VNGARGVIINITGGPDLSLVEVSSASTIVQEAAHEDANIIFGAVVDPELKGRVKITVIATGFDLAAVARPAVAQAQTPVDMTPYADAARGRVEVPPAAPMPIPPIAAPRLSIARRPLLDLPLSAAAAGGAAAGIATDPNTNDTVDLDSSVSFDIPAFLRRQEN
jgi:cell division protein FtsZ